MSTPLLPLSLFPSHYAPRNPFTCLFQNHPREPPNSPSPYHPRSFSSYQDFHACMEHLIYKHEHEKWLRQTWLLNLHQLRGRDKSAILAGLDSIETELELCAKVILLLAGEEKTETGPSAHSLEATSPPVPADLDETVDWKPDALQPEWKSMCLRHRLYCEEYELWLAAQENLGCDEEAVMKFADITAQLILYARIILLNVKPSVQPAANERGKYGILVAGSRKRKRAGRKGGQSGGAGSDATGEAQRLSMDM